MKIKKVKDRVIVSIPFWQFKNNIYDPKKEETYEKQ